MWSTLLLVSLTSVVPEVSAVRPLCGGCGAGGVVVSLRDGVAGDEDTRKRLQDFVRRELMPFKYPRLLEFCDGLPKTGTGKIDRHALQAVEAAAGE